MYEDERFPGISHNRRERGRGLKAPQEAPGARLNLEMERLEEDEEELQTKESPRLVYNRRRHSASRKVDDSLSLLPTFPVEKPKGRRHSLMVPSDALKRVSVDITSAQREQLQLPRFSQVFGFATFSGLPMLDYKDPVLSYENTYKMEPDKKFQPRVAEKVVEKVVDSLLYWDDDVLTDSGKKPTGKRELQAYESQKHKRRSKLIMKMVEEVKDEMKQLNYPRYKYVVNAVIGEMKGQGLRVASRSLWDTTNDSYICVQRFGVHGFVTVLVHAVYFD